MAWGEWMVPKPGPEQLLTLERQRRAVDSYDERQAKEMLKKLCQLSMHQDLIIRGALKRIAELELKEALGEARACEP
jgi:hypothetical protein